MSLAAVYQEWTEDPEGFWARQAGELAWYRRWDTVLDTTPDATGAPRHRWFAGGQLNAAYNCVDVHVEAGRGDTPALIFDSPQTGIRERYSYRRLQRAVAALAGALSGLGLRPGQPVLIFMPPVPQIVIAMLACARLGLTYSVVAPAVPATPPGGGVAGMLGGGAAGVLRRRIDEVRPAVVLTASGGFDGRRPVAYQPVLEAALARADHAPRRCLVLQRPGVARWVPRPGRDHDWSAMVAAAVPHPRPIRVEAGHPLSIMYTAGSAGRPKAVVRDTGGYLTALRWAARHVFGLRPGDVFWADSHPGWAAGHSFAVHGALLTGCATVLYEGSPVGTPDALEFRRIIDEYGVRVLSTTPMTLRRIRRELPAVLPPTRLAEVPGAPLAAVFLASERVEPGLMDWAASFFACPVIDAWWQAETGWPAATNCLGLGLLPGRPGSVTRPLPGYQVEILDGDGAPVPVGRRGRIAIRLPLPPGGLLGVWRDDERFRATYLRRFPGYFDTGDAGRFDADGYLWVDGSAEDLVDPGADGFSGPDVEHVMGAYLGVERCTVVAAGEPGTGPAPVAFVVTGAVAPRDLTVLAADLRDEVVRHTGGRVRLRRFVFVRGLPYTPSGKVRRASLRNWLRDGCPGAMVAGPPGRIGLPGPSRQAGTCGPDGVELVAEVSLSDTGDASRPREVVRRLEPVAACR